MILQKFSTSNEVTDNTINTNIGIDTCKNTQVYF